MSGPENPRGKDAFDDFFGDPSPSGSMGPAPTEPAPALDPEDQPTQDIRLGRDESGESTRQEDLGPSTAAAGAPGALPEDWWTSDAEPASQPAASHTWHAEPVPYPAPAPQPPRRGVSPFALVALLLGGVLLGGLFVGGTVMALGEDGQDEQPAASQTTVTTTSSETSSPSSTTPESSTPTSSSTTSSSSSSSPTRAGELPAGASSCAGPKEGTAVGRGTEVTTCQFAVAVRDAYVAGGPEGDTRLEVRSPVTKKDYTMSCTGQVVTRCTGGNNAVVYLY